MTAGPSCFASSMPAARWPSRSPSCAARSSPRSGGCSRATAPAWPGVWPPRLRGRRRGDRRRRRGAGQLVAQALRRGPRGRRRLVRRADPRGDHGGHPPGAAPETWRRHAVSARHGRMHRGPPARPAPPSGRPCRAPIRRGARRRRSRRGPAAACGGGTARGAGRKMQLLVELHRPARQVAVHQARILGLGPRAGRGSLAPGRCCAKPGAKRSSCASTSAADVARRSTRNGPGRGRSSTACGSPLRRA